MAVFISDITAPGLFTTMSLYSRFALNFKLTHDYALSAAYDVSVITWYGADWIDQVPPSLTMILKYQNDVTIPANWTGQSTTVDMDCMMMIGDPPAHGWTEKNDVHVGIRVTQRDPNTGEVIYYQYWKVSRVTDSFTVMNVHEGELQIASVNSVATFPENTTQSVLVDIYSRDGVSPQPLSCGVKYVSGPSPASFTVRGYTFTVDPGSPYIYNFWIPSVDNGEHRTEILDITVPPLGIVNNTMQFKVYAGRYRDDRYFPDAEYPLTGVISRNITENDVTVETFSVSGASVNPPGIMNGGTTTAYATVTCNKVASRNVSVVFTVKFPDSTILKTSPLVPCEIQGKNVMQVEWATGIIGGNAGRWTVCADVVV